jgi:hypothetical protein
MAQPCKTAMAARVGLSHLLDDFEDSRRPSLLLLGFAEFLWMDGCGGRRRQRQFIDKHLGQKGARTGPGVGWAGRPRPAGPGSLPGCFSHDPLFVCTCMWDFDIISFTVKAWILTMQASLFFGWVPEDLHVDASVLGSFGVMFIACLDSCRASWSSSKVLGELIPKVSSLTLISYVNNKLQNRHASVNLLHHWHA